MKSGFILKIGNAQNHGLIQVKCQDRHQGQIALKKNMHFVGSKSVVYYDFLKPDETVNFDHYQNQIVGLKKCLIAKRPECSNRHGKVIWLHDNSQGHTSKGVKSMLNLSWKVLTHSILQILLFQIFICFGRWHTLLPRRALKRTKMCKNWSLDGLH